MATPTLHPSSWSATRAALASKPQSDEDMIKALGQQALQSGEISPDEAMQHYQELNGEPPVQAMGSLQPGGDTPPVSVQKPAIARQPAPLPISETPQAHQFPVGPQGQTLTLDQFTGRPQDRGFKVDQTTGEKVKQALMMKKVLTSYDSPEEQKSRYDMAMESPGIQDQQKGISQMKDLISMQAQNMPKVQADIAGPLSRLYDSMHGGALTNPNPPPNLAQTQMEKLRNYFEKLQDDRKDLAKNIQLSVNGQRSGQNTFQDMQDREMTSKLLMDMFQKAQPQERKDTSAKDSEKYFKDFQNSRAYQAYGENQKHFDEMQRLRSQVALANASDDSIIPVIRASMAAHGRPNMAEVQMDAGSQAVMEKLQNAISKATSGHMSETNRQLILQSMDNILAQQAGVMKRQYGVVGNIAKRYHQDPSAVSDLLGAPPSWTPPGSAGEAPSDQIRVIRKSDGKTGVMPKAKFDSSKYDEVK